MIGYASRTGTRRNLDALRAAGWRLMLSPKGVLRTEGFQYALDNGAWSAHTQGLPFDECAFLSAVERFGGAADWVVLPDAVEGGLGSLSMSLSWRERLGRGRWMIAVQDGMTADDVRPVLDGCGIFVGGSSEWKEASLPMWGALAAEIGCPLHVGRVNTARRLHLCAAAGASSFDGSSASRFQKTLGLLDSARSARDLFAPVGLRARSAWE